MSFKYNDVEKLLDDLYAKADQSYKQGRYDVAIEFGKKIRDVVKQSKGENNFEYGQSICNLAALYTLTKSYKIAEKLNKEALDILFNTVGEDNPHYIRTLENMLTSYKETKMHDKAEPILQKTLKIKKKQLGEEHPDYVKALLNAGGWYYNNSINYHRACDIFKQALEIQRRTLGEEHRDYVHTLQILSSIYYHNLSDYVEAKKVNEQALEIQRRTLGEEHRDYVSSLNNLAILNFEHLSNYSEAEKLFKQALEIRRKTLGEEHPDYATTLHGLSSLYGELSRYEQAKKLAEQALEIQRRTLGEEHRDYVSSLNNLASICEKEGNYVKAKDLFKQALEITRKTLGEEHPDYAMYLGNIALIYMNLSNYEMAEKLQTKVLEIIRKTLGEEHNMTATSIYNLGESYFLHGNYPKAEKLFKQALEIRRKTLGEEHPDYATTLQRLSELNKNIGKYTNSKKLAEQALEIRRKTLGEEHPDYATSLSDLAMLHHFIGNSEIAESLQTKALEITRKTLGEEHPFYAIRLHNMASVYKKNNLTKAESTYLEAIRLAKKTLGDEHHGISLSLHNLAGIYEQKNNLTKAESTYLEVIKLQTKTLGIENPDYALSLHNLAELYYRMKKYDDSEKLFKQALEIRRKILGEESEQHNNTLKKLSILYLNTKRINEGIALLQKVLAIENYKFNNIFPNIDQNRQLDFLQRFQSTYQFFLASIIQFTPNSNLYVNLAYEMLLKRKSLGYAILAQIKKSTHVNNNLDKNTTTNNLSLSDREFLKKIFLEQIYVDGIPENKFTFKQDVNPNQNKLNNISFDVSLQEALRTVDLHSLSKSIPPDTVLVEFTIVVLDNFQDNPNKEKKDDKLHFIAFVLHGDDKINDVTMIDLGSVKSIESDIGFLRSAITGNVERRTGSYMYTVPKSREQTLKDTGIKLRKKLFDPLLTSVKGKRKIMICPEGDLSLLPFEILPLDDEEKCVIDDYEISYLMTGRDLLEFKNNITKNLKDSLVIADPDFDFHDNSLSEESVEDNFSDAFEKFPLFESLNETLAEGDKIAKLLNCKILHGKNALKSKLVSHISPFILHMATHGFFLPDLTGSPMTDSEIMSLFGDKKITDTRSIQDKRSEHSLLRSGIVLTGANFFLQRNSLEGILTAKEIINLDLTNTQLVVLSACDTGVGDIVLGEGLFGLRRSFMLAGSQTLVLSLWKVSDKHTRELMELFYNNLISSMGRVEALRHAQLAMKKKYKHPFFWGAFICQGNPSAIL